MTDAYRDDPMGNEPGRPRPDWTVDAAGASAYGGEGRPLPLSLPAAPPELERAWVFQQTLHEITPRVFVTYALVLANGLVFALMLLNGVHPLTPQIADLIRWGANLGVRVSHGDWWRLLTCMFIHIGVIHIACNMWVLWDVGPLVERLVGNIGFAVLYFVSGMVGSLVSAWWKPGVVSAGASGAVFGVFGALLSFVVMRRESIPHHVLHPLRNSVFAFLGFNLLYGWFQTGIDVAAHLGGLAGGFACGLILSQPVSQESLSGRRWRNLVTAAAGLAGVVAGTWAMQGRFVDADSVGRAFEKAEQEVLGAFNHAIEQVRTQQMTDDELATKLERELIPKWRAARESLGQLKQAPGVRHDIVTDFIRYAELRENGWETMVRAIRRHDPKLFEEANARQREAGDVLAKRNLKK